jgi:aminopeptidase N
VKLEPQPLEDLAVLFGHDPNPFNRWEAGQQIATRLLLDGIAAGGRITLPDGFVGAIDRLLADETLDAAFVAEAIVLPSEAFLADQMAEIDVEAIHAVREAARAQIGRALADRLRRRFDTLAEAGQPKIDAAAMGRRALRNACLAYLATDAGAIDLVVAQAEHGTTMTDVLAALSILRDLDTPERPRLLSAFYERWKDEALVIDKWFTLQATSSRPDTIATVEALLHHPAFTWRTPNRVRSVVSAFASANPLRFHSSDGAGYAFLADQIIHLNGMNPQLAARTLIPLGRWQRHEPKRRAMMQAQLDRILAEPGLSPDVFEIASKSRA